MKTCIQRYGKPLRTCTKPAKWWFKNPKTKELEGPYCGYHSRQFLPKALRPVPVKSTEDGLNDA